MLFFTELGRCFWMRVFEIPEGTRQSKGRAIQNLINIPQDDKVLAFINVLNLKDEEYINNHFIVMCTKQGIIKDFAWATVARVLTVLMQLRSVKGIILELKPTGSKTLYGCSQW